MTTKIVKPFLIAALIAIVSIPLQGCSFSLAAPTETPTATPVPPTDTPIPPTATYTATLTPSLTPTFTLTPSLTPTHTATFTPTATLTDTPFPLDYIPEGAIVIYFILQDTGGPVGCGDTLVPLTIGRMQTGNVEDDIATALNALFAAGQYHGGLYNATYLSDFKVAEVTEKKSNDYTIILKGNYVAPENRCEAQRYRAQVWQTARQFDEVKYVQINARGSLLDDLLYAVLIQKDNDN